jgi:hypothetical protein
MKRGRLIWIVGMAVCAVSLASAQQFIHLRSYTLADLFDGTANGIGSNIGDVAFDGTNLYVAGYHTSSGLQTVGMARISNFYSGTATLSPATQTLTPSWTGATVRKTAARATRA